MKFCPECGTNVEGMKFCHQCGYKIGNIPSQPTQADPYAQPDDFVQSDNPLKETTDGEQIICQFQTKLIVANNFEKKLIGDINISRAKEKYTLTTERLIIEKKGVIRSEREEIEGYKIRDITVSQGVVDKARGIGDITLLTTDPTTPEYVINNVEDPTDIADKIRTVARNSLRKMNIMHHEEL